MKKIDIGVIMGSDSDLATLKPCVELLKKAKVSFELKVVSAHRSPQQMVAYALQAHERGLKLIIAAAGGAAHLPGMVASLTLLPVIGVPVESRKLKGLDSLLSIAQMPAGVPVASMAIGEAGAANAALTALRILGITDKSKRAFVERYAKENLNKVKSMNLKLKGKSA